MKEIIECPSDLLKPPGMPEFVRGMLNLRGVILPVIDARLLYRLPDQGAAGTPKIIVFSRQNVTYGILVDSVESIVSFSEEEKLKLPPVLYQDTGKSGVGQEDIRFAVEIETQEEKRTLFIFNLDPLIKRTGFVDSRSA